MTDAPRLVAVAASAGGVEALKRLVQQLPADLPATVLVALHLPHTGRSMLAQILQRRSALPVAAAEHGAPLLPGTVVVAPTDAHLLVRDGHVVLGRGPRENGHRPSHDAMLRAVALAAGNRALGVVLTGMLDDGAAGLAAVARYGGRCLVQDPDDAEFPSMPRAALRAVPAASCRPLDHIAEEVVRMVSQPPDGVQPVEDAQRALDVAEVGSAEHGSPLLPDGSQLGEPSPFACPDCSGVLRSVPDDNVVRFRCRTGHAWSADSLGVEQEERIEEALWVALRVLEERADLTRRLAGEARDGHRHWSSDLYARRAEEVGRSIALIRRVLDEELSAPERTAAVQGT